MPRPIQYGQRARTNSPKSPSTPSATTAPPNENDKHTMLREMVLSHIGRPDDLIEVDIRNLWDHNHYRINVYREIKKRKFMTDSYFVYAVEDGIISSPPLDRKYLDDTLKKIYEDRPQSPDSEPPID